MKRLAAFLLALTLGPVPGAMAATLLIGNTSGNNVLKANTVTNTITEFIAAGSGGLVSPDDLTYGPDGNLYVSSGTDTDGAILRFDGRTGAFIDEFATSPSMKRPYGNAFGPDGYLYVASFRSDEILRFDGTTGAFIDVFASGIGAENGLNGPNDLAFGPDGALYVTTQGSVADGMGGIAYLHSSQVLRYDIVTGTGSVFVDQPVPLPESFGFVSLLGIAFAPDGTLWTSDFANGLRLHDPVTGALIDAFSTNFSGTIPSSNFIGNMAFVGNRLFVAGFDFTKGNAGSLLSYDVPGGLPAFATLFPDDPALLRPIGIVGYAPIPLPAGIWLLGGALCVMLAAGRRPSRPTGGRRGPDQAGVDSRAG
jgi:sugar lactone lactonase YvrE